MLGAIKISVNVFWTGIYWRSHVLQEVAHFTNNLKKLAQHYQQS